MHLTRRSFMSALAAATLGGAGRFAVGDENAPDADEHIRDLADNAPLSMRFEGSTAEECRAWQKTFSAKLSELLGEHAPPRKWKTIFEDVTELDDHTRHQLVLSAEGHPSLPVYVLTPKPPGEGKRPAIVALHGHGSHGYHPIAGRDDLPGVAQAIASANYDYGRRLVKRGYVVAAPCLTPFGRRLSGDYAKQDPCAVTFVRMQLLGKVLMAENLRDARWAVELLAEHEAVDPERIGCVGLSYGGRMTMLTAALEPRIKVAVVSGALNVMQERVRVRYSCGAQVIPGLLRYGDVPEIGSLIAPRPCLWEIGSQDGLIKQPWADEAIERIQRAYAALGAEERLVIDRFEGGHRWHGEVAYPLMERALKPPKT